MARDGQDTIWDRLTHPITLVVCTTIALIAAISGPFGTLETMQFPARIGYWLAIVFGTTVAAYTVRAVLLDHAAKRRPFLFEMQATVLMVVICTPYIWLLNLLLGARQCISLACFAQTAGYIAVITILVFVVRRVIPGFEELVFFAKDESGGILLVAPSPLVGVPVDRDEARPRLFRRLPKDTQGEILHLTANGHFVVVTLDTGAREIRMRFGDAVNEMDAVDGHCAHRSHWVATAAVAGHDRVDGKQVLILTNGMQVPVSRTYRPGLEQAGLLPVQQKSA